MVLSEFKQVYIGKTDTSVKKRIMRHWREKITLPRAIYGDVLTSRLSINSFSALDTTEVFVCETADLFGKERECVDDFPEMYLCNRVRGGYYGDKPAPNMPKRNLAAFTCD